MSDDGLNGHVHPISQYFNKRFYKFTETGRDYLAETDAQIKQSDIEGGKTLFVSEGNLLPSKTEMGLARKAHFELYTITNLSLLEIAEYLTMRPQVIAVAKHNLANREESVAEFGHKKWFTNSTVVDLLPDNVPTIKARPVNIPYVATFDVHHSRDCIYETSAKVKEALGQIDNVAVFERETYETFVHDVVAQGNFHIEKAVRLNLKDYKNESKHVDLTKVSSKSGTSVLLISETTTYQSNVPF